MIQFDEAYWLEAIKKPDWYIEFVPWAKRIQDSLGEDSKESNEFRKTIRHFFEAELLKRNVALAGSGPDFDAERLLIDTIVIHHTSAAPGYRLSYMNAVQLLNIYASHFANSKSGDNKHFPGQPAWPGNPVWSGHFIDGEQVFYCYHWLMRMDGSFERLLDDKQIGWHAGNWQINRRSVAICLDNDYEKQDPTDEILENLAAFIRDKYDKISIDKIIGHSEASHKTICPGANFKNVWKTNLVGLVR